MEKTMLFLLLACVAMATAQKLVCDKQATINGNAGGERCKFPFKYLGQDYDECTVVNHNNVLWCSTTDNYDRDRIWGECMCSFTFTDSTANGPAPPTNGGNGDGDGCVEETVNGEKCSPNFKYKFETYSGCTSRDNRGRPWCSLTEDYNVDRKWNDCKIPLQCETPQTGTGCTETTVSEQECAQRFMYNKVSYTGCTTVDNQGTPWCSLTSDFDKDGLYGNCRSPLQCVTSGSAGAGCIEETFAGDNCAPTYKYRGNMYNGCTTVDNNDIPWCAMTEDFDRDGEWSRCKTPLKCTQGSNGGGCVEKTKKGLNCAPEYIYNGRLYIGCTRQDYHVPWCSLTESYDKYRTFDECKTPLKCTSTQGSGN